MLIIVYTLYLQYKLYNVINYSLRFVPYLIMNIRIVDINLISLILLAVVVHIYQVSLPPTIRSNVPLSSGPRPPTRGVLATFERSHSEPPTGSNVVQVYKPESERRLSDSLYCSTIDLTISGL